MPANGFKLATRAPLTDLPPNGEKSVWRGCLAMAAPRNGLANACTSPLRLHVLGRRNAPAERNRAPI
eukprot:1056827-Lingulodinium_polyedra.AAC.1